ncbi:hypothetical protein [Shigella phage ESh12]|nr:hypothetical protein [Shigella phage ESh12]
MRQHFRLSYRPLEEIPKVNRRLNPRGRDGFRWL